VVGDGGSATRWTSPARSPTSSRRPTSRRSGPSTSAPPSAPPSNPATRSPGSGKTTSPPTRTAGSPSQPATSAATPHSCRCCRACCLQCESQYTSSAAPTTPSCHPPMAATSPSGYRTAGSRPWTPATSPGNRSRPVRRHRRRLSCTRRYTRRAPMIPLEEPLHPLHVERGHQPRPTPSSHRRRL
jgi:hypothetical protein